MSEFYNFNLNNNILSGLDKLGLKNPTSIQEKTFLTISNNRDLIACSATGTGKTMAYLIPLLNVLVNNQSSTNQEDDTNISTKNVNVQQDNNYSKNAVQVIILVPTQELGAQVARETHKLCELSNISIKTLLLIGDGNINRQIESIKHNKPNIVVCTPSRLAKLIKLKKIKVHQVKTLVLDEADRLMDKTCYEDILFIRKSLMKRTQVLLFSASMNKKTIKSANVITYKPVILDLISENKECIPKTIKHIYFISDRRQRIEMLRKIVKANNGGKTLIFINTKYDLEETFQKLQYHHYNVGSIAGNLDNHTKKKVIEDFKSGKIQYLLATDVASRGLQIDNISTVINLNLPEESIEYQHRAGRCGRNGNIGLCISIITENELSKIKKYQKLFHVNFVQKKLFQGKIVGK